MASKMSVDNNDMKSSNQALESNVSNNNNQMNALQSNTTIKEVEDVKRI